MILIFFSASGKDLPVGQVTEIFSHFTFLISQMHCPLVPKIMLIYIYVTYYFVGNLNILQITFLGVSGSTCLFFACVL